MRIVVLLVLVSSTVAKHLATETCDVTQSKVDVDMAQANVIFGGLFEIRKPSTDGRYACGQPYKDLIQLYEAAVWSLRKLNTLNYIQNLKFGMKAFDTCSSAYRATQAAQEFYPQFSSVRSNCSLSTQISLGLLGTFSSGTSKAVAHLTTQYPALMISPRATSPALSDKMKYPYFFRTTPSATSQIQAMLAVMESLQWERVLLVHTDSDYGQDGYLEFVRQTLRSGRCVVQAVSVPALGTLSDYQNKLQDIANYGVNGAVFFGSKLNVPTLLDALENIAQTSPQVGNLQWIVSDLNLMEDYSAKKFSQGLLYVVTRTIEVSEFTDYFVTLNENSPPTHNPWLADWYMTENGCKLSGVNYPPYSGFTQTCTFMSEAQKRDAFRQIPWVASTVMAVYAYSRALKNFMSDRGCSAFGSNCPQLQSMTVSDFQNYLKNVDFTFGSQEGIPSLNGVRVQFDANGDIINHEFSVWNYRRAAVTGTLQFQKVGQYQSSGLIMDKGLIQMYDSSRNNELTSLPISTCPVGGCFSCVVAWEMVRFNFIPGDIVIGGVFDVHDSGTEAFSCSSLTNSGPQAAMAFHYALNSIKSYYPGILNGVDIGGIIADVCSSGQTARLFLNNVFGERHVVRSNGRLVDPNIIHSMVEGVGSSVTQVLSEALGKFGLPEVGSMATSTALSNQERFPFYARTVPDDLRQAEAIMQVLKSLGWNYIQTIQSASSYGRVGIQTLRHVGEYRGVCIAASYEVGTDGSYQDIVQKLRLKPAAHAVVIFAGTSNYRGILQAIKDLNAFGEFVLVGSENWGNKKVIVSGLEDVARGSITVQLGSWPTDRYQTWLRGLDPRVYNTVPWFAEWYEKMYNCYILVSNKAIYDTPCSNTPITNAPNYQESPYVPYVINAVYAVAQSFHRVLQDKCGQTYSGVCAAFRAAPNIREDIFAKISPTSFMGVGNQAVEIVNGQGISSYEILNYGQNGYVKTGEYNTGTRDYQQQQQILLPAGLDPLTMAQCRGRCEECAYVFRRPQFAYYPGDINIGALFALHDTDADGPFLCGESRLGFGFQSLIALGYAVWNVNSGNAPVSLNGVTLGTSFLDTCNAPTRAFGLLSSLYSGIVTRSTLDMQMQQLDINNVLAWMTDSTASTAEANEILKPLGIPIISPMATSAAFKNLDNYPSFFRTVQGAMTSSLAIAKLAKSLNFLFVSIIHSGNQFGRDGSKTFQEIGLQEGICALESYEVGTDGTAAEIIANLVSTTSHVIVLFTGSVDTLALVNARAANPNAANLVFLSAEGMDDVLRSAGSGATNFLSLHLKSDILQTYKNQLNAMVMNALNNTARHPLYEKYYEDIWECSLPGSYRYSNSCPQPLKPLYDAPNYYQATDKYMLPTINAVYAFTAAVDAALKEKCGEDYDGVCTEFINADDLNDILLDKLAAVTFTDPTGAAFQFIDREGNTGYNLMLWDGSENIKVGDFAGASMKINSAVLSNRFTNVISTCTEPCDVCIQRSMQFSLLPGDIYVTGIFDVHQKDIGPFTCGQIKTLHGFQLLEAFHYALNKVNKKKGQFASILNGIQLGGVGLDACQSMIKTGYLASNIHNGLLKLVKNGNEVTPDDIMAYIGAYSSDNSIYLARILKTLKMPQVSYASTSIQLLDQNKYPYFLRTVPADDRQSLAIAKFLDKFNIRYVQVLHTPNNFGELGAKVFNELARENKICVSQTIAFPDNGTVTRESANNVVAALLEKPISNTIVVYADTSYIHELLMAVDRNPDAAEGKFRFIGSEKWANNMDAIAGVERLAEESVTLNLETADLSEFDVFLASKTPVNYPQNPWFPEFYEEMYDCYLTVPIRRYSGQCPAESRDIVVSPRYTQDPGILHVINSVYASAYGIHRALRDICGVNYTTVCEAFKNNADRRELVLNAMKSAQFTDPSGKEFQFTDRGDGNKGYVIYSLEPSERTGVVYEPVGSFSSSGVLTVEQTYTPEWDGSCKRPDSCAECPSVRDRIQRYLLRPGKTDNPGTVAYVTAVHNQGLDAYRCGALNPDMFVNSVMAFLFTLDRIVKNVPFDLRGLILDNCDNPLRMDQDLFNLLSSGDLCNTNFDTQSLINNSTISGFMTDKSQEVVAANRILGPIGISLIGSSSSSVILNDKNNFPYVLRTIPPDSRQMKLIADILKRQGWNYVSAVYSTETYGITGLDELQKAGRDFGVCIGLSVPQNIPGSDSEAEAIVTQLINQPGANVVVLVSADPRPILEAADRLGVLNRFVWIGTDSWGTRASVIDGFEIDKLAGAITVDTRGAVKGELLDEFTAYINELSAADTKGVPSDWLSEYLAVRDQGWVTNATMRVMAATYALVEGTKKLKVLCPGKTTLNECLDFVENGREKLYQAIWATEWSINDEFVLDEEFDLSFNADRYWDTGYRVFNLQSMPGDRHVYNPIGKSLQGTLTLDGKYESNRPSGVISQCPEGRVCDCDLQEAVTSQPQTQDKIPTEPRNYYLYDKITGDDGIEVFKQVWEWPVWAIVVAILTCLGLLIGIILFLILLIIYPIKGGTTILGFLSMLGILGIYGLNFAFFLPAAEATCGARRFCMGVIYAIVFAALLVKAVDNWRFLDVTYDVKRYQGLTSSFALFCIALGIILIQVIIPVQWLWLVRPTASRLSDAEHHDWWWCDPPDMYDRDLVLSMLFVMFLVLLTAIFAALAWDSESNYYESRWILVGAICTAGCFLVWMIVTTMAGGPFRDPAVAIANLINATALLICFPIRKTGLLCLVWWEEKREKEEEPEPGHELYSTVHPYESYELSPQNDDVFHDFKPESEHGY